MTDLQVNSFDYSLLDKETVEYLQEREISMARTLEKTSEKIGEDLYKAQQKLANYGNGKFEEWFTSLGFKKTNVYDYIKRYKFVRQLNEPDDIKQFQQLPVKLQNEISKPSANTELNQKVFDGDITTHKQYKVLEQKLKEKDSQLEQAKKLEKKAIDQLKKEQSKEPETIKVVPHDYEGLKSDIKQLELSNRQYRKKIESAEKRKEFIEAQYNELLEQRKEVNEKSKKYDELNEAIQDMQGKMDEGQKQIKAQKDVYELVRKTNDLIVEVAPLTYLIDVENVLKNEYAQKPIRKIITSLRDMADRLESSVEQDILEGEIINE